MNILFFDCDKRAEKFLHTHFPKSSSYHTVDFELNTQNIDKIVNPEVFDVISVFAHANPIGNHLLDKFSNLKMIATRSTGFNHIDLNYCKSRNILVCNVPNYGSVSVAEFTIALMLGILRKIYLAKSHMKSNNVNMNEYLGESINGKTIGIIGYGAIGQAVCHLLKAFGCHILVYDPYTNQNRSNKEIVFTLSLNELYQKSDIISLHCPANEQNFHLLNQSAFETMKNGVYIINTARGSLIDTESLYHALKSGKVAGAALDVLENEDIITEREISTDMEKKSNEFLLDSIINFKMLQLNNTLITPHIAFNSTDAIDKIFKTTIDNICCFIDNKPKNCII